MPHLTAGLPDPLRTVHLMGIGGTAMGALAGMLKDAGYAVTGSDHGVYPPMSEYLAGLGVRVMEGFLAANLAPDRPGGPPDLVVVGNVVRAEYPEAAALLASDLPYLSLPQLLGELWLKEAWSVVVAGTHGKTTTTAITAWLAQAAGRDPGYLVGGLVKGWERTAAAGGGRLFVIEGDEYDTAFFDKRPKFLHYRARTALVTSVEFDHADIYRDLAHVKESFRALVAQLPEDGHLVARWDHPDVRDVCREARCEVTGYGPHQDWDGRVEEVDTDRGVMRFSVLHRGLVWGTFQSVLVGRHNLYNQVAAVAALARLGLGPDELGPGFASFQGVRRRQEVRGEPGGVTVVDDFAHHPTAVRVTLDALRLRFGQRRLWVVFEPRSATSRRAVFQEAYADAFGGADRVIVASPHDQSRITTEERFDSHRLAADLRGRGVEALAIDDVDGIAAVVVAQVMEQDVVAVFSNGGFGGLHQKLLDGLAQRFESRRDMA